MCRITASRYLCLSDYFWNHPVPYMLKANPFTVFCSAFLLPLLQLMLHSLCSQFPLQDSECYPPLQCTKLYHQFSALAVLPESCYVLYRNEQTVPLPYSMSIFVTWSLKHHHLFMLNPSETQILPFLSAALINIQAPGGRQRKCVCQASLSSPSLTARYPSLQISIQYIYSKIFPPYSLSNSFIQINSPGSSYIFFPCSLSVYAKSGPPNHLTWDTQCHGYLLCLRYWGQMVFSRFYVLFEET